MKDFVFKKKFGQNFISDKNLLSAIVKDAEIDKRDNVLEIGAGGGSLTAILAEHAKKVIAFEIDKDLQEHLLSLNLLNVEFLFQDFMKANLKEIESQFGEKYKVVANLPYYITTPIIFKLFEESENLLSITIMVQKEVAERICSSEGNKNYGILSVLTNFYGTPKLNRTIHRQMFFPVPNVDSALLTIKLEPNKYKINKKAFAKFVQLCFSMRRKTLLNNLSRKFDKNKLKQNFDEKTLSKRAEQFSLNEFVEMFLACEELK